MAAMPEKRPYPAGKLPQLNWFDAPALKMRGRKVSSQRWLTRQLNDPFVAEAKSRGFRSRAALKLEQIDDRYKLLKPGMAVVDLGCAPGLDAGCFDAHQVRPRPRPPCWY